MLSATTTSPSDRLSPPGRRGRLGIDAGAVVAVTVVGLVVTSAADATERPVRLAPQQRTAEPAMIAEWAEAHGLSGLSPASVGAPDRDLELESRIAAERAAIAEYAIAEGQRPLAGVNHPLPSSGALAPNRARSDPRATASSSSSI